MKHELFKSIPLVQGGDFVKDNKEVLEFINSGISPKSITRSACFYFSSLRSREFIVIGYTNDTTKHKYEFHTHKFNLSDVGVNHIGTELSQAASKLNGVICVDISTVNGLFDGAVEALFLTTKQK